MPVRIPVSCTAKRRGARKNPKLSDADKLPLAHVKGSDYAQHTLLWPCCGAVTERVCAGRSARLRRLAQQRGTFMIAVGTPSAHSSNQRTLHRSICAGALPAWPRPRAGSRAVHTRTRHEQRRASRTAGASRPLPAGTHRAHDMRNTLASAADMARDGTQARARAQRVCAKLSAASFTAHRTPPARRARACDGACEIPPTQTGCVGRT